MNLPQLDTKIEHTNNVEPTLNDEGYLKVRQYLESTIQSTNHHTLGAADWLVQGIGRNWVTKEGTYPKRMKKKMHDLLGRSGIDTYNFEAVDFGHLGAMARRYVVSEEKYIFDITETLRWTAGDFGDRTSCFWASNTRARDVLEEAGAMALRFYENGVGRARSWLVPYTNKLILFNAYGKYELHQQAEVLGKYLGVEHKSISLENWGATGGLVYINNGEGRLVGDPLDWNYKDLEIGDDDSNVCSHCESHYSNDEGGTVDGDGVCESCYDESNYCEECEERTFGEMTEIENGYYCDHCLERHFTRCNVHDVYYRDGCPEQPFCSEHDESYDCGSECEMCEEEKEKEEADEPQ